MALITMVLYTTTIDINIKPFLLKELILRRQNSRLASSRTALVLQYIVGCVIETSHRVHTILMFWDHLNNFQTFRRLGSVKTYTQRLFSRALPVSNTAQAHARETRAPNIQTRSTCTRVFETNLTAYKKKIIIKPLTY